MDAVCHVCTAQMSSLSPAERVWDIRGQRGALSVERATELAAPILVGGDTSAERAVLSTWALSPASAAVVARALAALPGLTAVDASDIVAGRPEAEALEVYRVLSEAFAALPGLVDLDLSDNAFGPKVGQLAGAAAPLPAASQHCSSSKQPQQRHLAAVVAAAAAALPPPPPQQQQRQPRGQGQPLHTRACAAQGLAAFHPSLVACAGRLRRARFCNGGVSAETAEGLVRAHRGGHAGLFYLSPCPACVCAWRAARDIRAERGRLHVPRAAPLRAQHDGRWRCDCGGGDPRVVTTHGRTRRASSPFPPPCTQILHAHTRRCCCVPRALAGRLSLLFVPRRVAWRRRDCGGAAHDRPPRVP